MANKQTAVEWLYDRFLFAGYAIPTGWKEQAKQMEKEQIIKAYLSSYKEGQYSEDKTAEEYCNETYNQKEYEN